MEKERREETQGKDEEDLSRESSASITVLEEWSRGSPQPKASGQKRVSRQEVDSGSQSDIHVDCERDTGNLAQKNWQRKEENLRSSQNVKKKKEKDEEEEEEEENKKNEYEEKKKRKK